ncbi:hypothetical protein HIM_02364 [Hirsutella minnesotensis 3608]|nr:hypothetical protein HIM_02364 [Hirsutella minnesotensis 3608]
MPVPKPPASLDGSCSVIHDKRLYSYTPEAFTSIPLENDAEWDTLKMGVKVTGGVCVGSTPPDASQAGFYVVGGKSDAGDYSGLQKYTYATKEWSTIQLTDQVTKNRQGHAAHYIMADDAILMYAGSQDGSVHPSSQTFTIKVSEPFAVRGYESVAPPSVSPILFRWSDADAAMITGGGDPQDAKVWLFNPTARWRDSGASLAEPVKDTASTKICPIDGDDGSKMLYMFDFGQSPVAVDQVFVQDPKGAPVHDSRPIGRRGIGRTDYKTKRDLTWDKWPKYNSTFRPEGKRKVSSMATSPDGTVAFSGPDGLDLFNAKENSWLNASAMLGKKEQLALIASASTFSETTSTTSETTSLTSSTPTSSMTQTSASISPSTTSVASSGTPTSTSPAAVSTGQGNIGDSGPSSNTILGITLGCILGFMALLGLILLMLRRRKKRRSPTPGDDVLNEKDAAAFSPSLLPPKPLGAQGHYPRPSRESWSSMAILMGRAGKERPPLTRKPSNDTNRSSSSSLHKAFKSTISKPIPQAATHPGLVPDEKSVAFAPNVGQPRPRNRNGPVDPNDSTRRSSGWNRYWSGGSALQILGLGQSKRKSGISEQSSAYSDHGNSLHPSTAGNVQPLLVRKDSATVPPSNFERRPEVNNVVSGSPQVAQFASGVPAEGMSGKIVRPTSDASSGYSSGVPESINDTWDAAVAGKPWGANRAPVSTYSPAHQYGTSQSSIGVLRAPPSGMSSQPQLAMAANSSDMSWLNLGDQSRAK